MADEMAPSGQTGAGTETKVDAERLYSTPRADVWAEEFAKVCPDVDQGLMICWFANAIETGRNIAQRNLDPIVRDFDAWRMAEWDALPDNVCFIAGCDAGETDVRGPVSLRDGSIHKACPEHWAPIMRVLGEQQTWQQDAMTTEEARRG